MNHESLAVCPISYTSTCRGSYPVTLIYKDPTPWVGCNLQTDRNANKQQAPKPCFQWSCYCGSIGIGYTKTVVCVAGQIRWQRAVQAGNCGQGSKLGWWCGPLVTTHLSGIDVLNFLIFSILEIIVSYILSFCCCCYFFRQEDKSGPFHSL